VRLAALGMSNRLCQLLLTGPVDGLYTIEMSPDLRNWTPISTNALSADGFVLTADPTSSNRSQGFYRARLANRPPLAMAAATPASGVAPLAVAFSSAGSFDPEGAALTYSWTFGDGATSTLPNPTHTYSTSGTFVAHLTVSDGVNLTTSANLTIIVANGASGLVAAYGFEEGAGTDVADVSGHGNQGVLYGASWTAGGRFGKALSFTTGSLVIANDSTSLHLTTGLTLEAWVYPTALTTNWMSVVSKGNPDQILSYVLQGCTPPGRVPSLYVNPAPSNLLAPLPLPLNTWTHLAGTYSGSTMRFYTNGVLVASRSQTGNIGISADPLTIGGNLFGNSSWQGLIDEVRIYNRSLSAAEIQSDMNHPVIGN